jgi:hypothetical protein
MMMETKKLRKFWALAKKVISKDEEKIRRWLWERYGVWSPHDLKYDDQEVVLAKLEEMANHGDEKITQDVWNNGQPIYCPQLDELIKEFAKRRNYQWRYTTRRGRKIVKNMTSYHLETLYKLLAYFTPAYIHELAELLARIAAAVRRNGEPETFAARCRFTIRHSLFAIRYSLPFSARQEPRPPIFAPPTEVGGYETKPAKAG